MKNRIMLNSHSELPLNDDNSNLFLQIMVAVSVFLFAITMAGHITIKKAAESWTHGISGTMTVQIKPSEEPLKSEDENLRINQVIHFFEQQPEVEKVSLISDKQMQKLMSPWLGKSADLKALPLPRLLDVHLKNNILPDMTKLSEDLAQIAPYAAMDNHRVWLSRLLQFSNALKILAQAVLLMVLTSSAFSIFYATKTSLGLHSQIIEILHIIGATDDYIARQYARRSFYTGFVAGVFGLLTALVALYVIGRAAGGLESGMLAVSPLSMENWLVIISLPLWAAVLSMFTAYWTVKNVLGKIL